MDELSTEELKYLHMIAVEISGCEDFTNKCPSVLNTKSFYDSTTFIYIGMLMFRTASKVIADDANYDFEDIRDRAGHIHSSIVNLHKYTPNPISFSAVYEKAISDINTTLEGIYKRVYKTGISIETTLAMDVAKWIFINLTQGKYDENEKTLAIRFIARVLIDTCTDHGTK